jgi:chemotaxis methyl-accepting protein methylase
MKNIKKMHYYHKRRGKYNLPSKLETTVNGSIVQEQLTRPDSKNDNFSNKHDYGTWLEKGFLQELTLRNIELNPNDPKFSQTARKYGVPGETYFFRFPELINQITDFVKRHNQTKIISVGCSTGQELYSILSHLTSLGLNQKVDLTGYDINPHSINVAKKGIYDLNTIAEAQYFSLMQTNFSKEDMNNNHKNYNNNNNQTRNNNPPHNNNNNHNSNTNNNQDNNYNKENQNNNLELYLRLAKDSDKIKFHDNLIEQIKFQQRDIIKEPLEESADIILINNVLIYFEPTVREQVFENCIKSINAGGLIHLEQYKGEYIYSRSAEYTAWRQNISQRYPTVTPADSKTITSLFQKAI